MLRTCTLGILIYLIPARFGQENLVLSRDCLTKVSTPHRCNVSFMMENMDIRSEYLSFSWVSSFQRFASRLLSFHFICRWWSPWLASPVINMYSSTMLTALCFAHSCPTVDSNGTKRLPCTKIIFIGRRISLSAKLYTQTWKGSFSIASVHPLATKKDFHLFLFGCDCTLIIPALLQVTRTTPRDMATTVRDLATQIDIAVSWVFQRSLIRILHPWFTSAATTL